MQVISGLRNLFGLAVKERAQYIDFGKIQKGDPALALSLNIYFLCILEHNSYIAFSVVFATEKLKPSTFAPFISHLSS